MIKWCNIGARLLIIANLVLGERILFLSVAATRSHQISFTEPMVKALAARGHDVTVVSPFEQRQPTDNVREIVVPNLLDGWDEEWFEWRQDSALVRTWNEWEGHLMFLTLGYDILVQSKELAQIVRAQKRQAAAAKSPVVDLVVVDASVNDFVLPLVDFLGAPFVLYYPTSVTSDVLQTAGISEYHYASVPTELVDCDGDTMSFLERVDNFVSNSWMWLYRNRIIWPMLEDYVRKDLPATRSIADIAASASLSLVNMEPTTAWLRPLPPNVIAVQGVHLRPAAALSLVN